MTCDTDRPCKRCIQRGLQSSCEDAPRKRKKYLADVPSSLIQPHKDSSGSEDSGAGGDRTPLGRLHVFQATMFQHSALLPNYSVHTHSQLARTTTVAGVKPEASDEMYGGYYGRTNPGMSSTNMNVTSTMDSMGTAMSGTMSGMSHIGNGGNAAGSNGNGGGSGNANLGNSGNPGNSGNSNGANGAMQDSRKRTNFLSLAADLEYSTLSSILQDNFMAFNPNLTTSTEGTPNSVNSPGLSPHGLGLPKNSPTSVAPIESELDKNYLASDLVRCDSRINQYFLGTTSTGNTIHFPEVIHAIEAMKKADPAAYYVRNSELGISFTIGISQDQASGKNENLQFKEPEEIYVRVNHPFSYTPGFHKLIAYLRGRFPRDMLVKMAESMAVYRPSFIACTNSLREADLIFMEQCFQRTLLTYDKFLSISGTPTIVWRRTGEIAYVGHEFTILTGWTQDQLMGEKPMFIVEVLDDKSVVEYFRLFSKIAFGDFLGATMTECTLLTPQKDIKIRAGCMWTLKRDVFGIPMMIIGNFLPIL